jgi:hypothetical protein
MSRDDILDRAANNMMLLSQDIRNGAKVTERSTEALRSVVEGLLAVKRELHDAIGAGGVIDESVRGVRHELGQINVRLGIIANDAHVTREATGTHRTVQPDVKVTLMNTFGALPWYSQVLLAAGTVGVGGIGALVHWLATHGVK